MAVYCLLDECIRSSVDLLIRDVFIVLYLKERRWRPVVTVSDKHACKTNQRIKCIHQCALVPSNNVTCK